MKQYWTKFELAESWQLSQEEILCIQNKHNKLGYAIKMKYFDNIGRFPTTDKEIPYVIKEHLAKQLSAPVTSIKAYKWTGRHAQIHNAEIRERYGYRKFDYKDLTSIDSLIKNSLFVQDLSVLQTQEEVYTFLKKHKIEPPADKELTRYVSKSFNKCESKFFARCFNNMSPEIKESLCSLFEEYEDDQSKLSILKELVGKASIKTIKEELQKLALLEKTQILYEEFFERIPYKLLKKYHDRVAISSPSSLLKIKQNDISKFYALLACFCKYKGGKIIDNLIEILTRKVERWHSIAKGKVKETLWAEYTHDDKDKLLDDLVDISLAYPEGVIKEKIYPGVGGKEKLEKSKLSRQSIKARLKKLEYEYMSRVYIPARASLLEILNRLILKSNSPSAILDAAQCFSRKEPLNIKGLLNKVEILAFSNEAGELNKMSQEVAMFSLLRKELKCKNIWAKGALKCCDPNKDVPKDFNQNKAKYFEMVPVSPSAEEETLKLKNEMLKWIKVFNTSILTDPDVRIEPKKGKPHIYVTPYEAQKEPENLKALKEEISFLWPNIGLLDVLKEADLRIGLTSALIDTVDKTSLDTNLLQQRLLIALFALGSNTEFKRVCSGIANASEQDLKYIRKRFLTPENLRYVIRKLINATIAIRDKSVWGEIENCFASDSIRFEAWDDNLMTEFCIRHKGSGLMAYWHVGKKALCVMGQVIKYSSSEVAPMLLGIIHHSTNAKIEHHSTDTHGQSLVAFAFSYLLGIELRPRIKGAGSIKLNKPDANMAAADYCNIADVMCRPIDWQLIIDHYEQIIQYVIALKLKTAEPEVLLKRFIRENSQSSLYKACLELGRVVWRRLELGVAPIRKWPPISGKKNPLRRPHNEVFLWLQNHIPQDEYDMYQSTGKAAYEI